MSVGPGRGGADLPPCTDVSRADSLGVSYNEDRALFPPGVTLIERFLTPIEEQGLLAMIDSSEWSHDLGRRTQQYGYKFDYVTETVMPMPPPP